MITTSRKMARLIQFSCAMSYIFLFTFTFGSLPASSSEDSLAQGQQLKHGEQLVSAFGTFTLGFFNLTNSCYLGIQYKLAFKKYTEKPVWVANRNSPIPCASLVLSINGNGSLVIKYGDGKALPLYSVENATSTKAILEESGNFVLRDIRKNRVLWESFDYPTDSLLPKMKVGFNKKTGQNWSLVSWKTNSLPALGSFTFGIHPNHTNQLAIWWRGDIYWRSGPWQQKDGTFENSNGLSESIYYNQDPYYYYNQDPYYYWRPGWHSTLESDLSHAIYNFHYHTTEDEVYFTYSVNKSSLYLGPIQQVPRLTITPSGKICKAGVFCVVSCFDSYDGDCYYSDYSSDSGCVKREPPSCRDRYFEGEILVMSTEGFKFEDNENLTLYDCAVKCKNNCSCLAYASTNVTYDTGCEIWSEVTSFNRTFENLDSAGREIYLYGLQHQTGFGSGGKIKWWISLVVIGVLIALPIFCHVCYVIWKRCKAEVEKIIKRTTLIREIGGRTVVSFLYDIAHRRGKAQKRDNEIQIFSFRSIAAATKKFSVANKLGEGGFGSVYKGTLQDGQEIAIKRLSKRSGQGLVEFKNEAILIAKLQHTSLVRLLGFCVEREERILVYEFMPNKSLDFYLFDSENKKILNWSCRFNIIQGIAQGLVYLHEYSRLTVIHRDLKASNILLDSEMNPKISDFGMARIFELKGIEENTNRIVGTYGYMSPEYAMNGIVSIKIDVFSFRVLLLEILSGKKNNSRYHSDHPLNLIGLAWQLWREDKAIEIIDPPLLECCPSHEALRCVQVGLLCVQDRAADRPSMFEVVSMLSNETASLPTPKQPAFYIDVEESEPNGSEEQPKTCSINEVTISVMDAR